MATIVLPQGAPDDMSMTRFKAIADNYGSLAKQCRFAVIIRPTGRRVADMATNMRDITYLCTTAEFPGRAVEPMANRYYGPEFNLPRNSKYPDSMNLAILCRARSQERKMFDDWMDIINPPDNWNFEYRDNYVAQVDVYHFAEFGEEKTDRAPIATYQWSLVDAYPMEVSETQVTWADQDVLSLSVSFSYRYWKRPLTTV